MKYSRETLIKLSGIMWLVFGVVLLGRSIGWLRYGSSGQVILLLSAGIVLGIFLYRLVFIALIDKYVARINSLPEKAFVLLCFAPRTWLMIAFMSSKGVFLRNSSIPKLLLVAPYIMMAICLLAGGMQFIKNSHNH